MATGSGSQGSPSGRRTCSSSSESWRASSASVPLPSGLPPRISTPAPQNRELCRGPGASTRSGRRSRIAAAHERIRCRRVSRRRIVRRRAGARPARPCLLERCAARAPVRPSSDLGWPRARVFVRRSRRLRSVEAVSGPRLPARRRRPPSCPGDQPDRVDALPSGVDEISVFPAGWARVRVVVRQPDRQPRAHPRSAQADLQRRRKPCVPHGHVGWRHRRVLRGVQGHDAMGVVSSAHRRHDGAGHAVGARRRRHLSRQRRQQTALHRERRTRSAVSRACEPRLRESSAEAGGAGGVPRIPGDRNIPPRGGRTSGRHSRSSCTIIRASRCPTRFRGRPIAPIATTGRIGSSSTSSAAVDGESRLPDTNLLHRGRELDFGLRINSAVDRGRRASDVVAGSNAFQLGLRTGDRFVEVNGNAVQSGRDIAEQMEKWEVGSAVRLVDRAQRRAPRRSRVRSAPTEVDSAGVCDFSAGRGRRGASMSSGVGM